MMLRHRARRSTNDDHAFTHAYSVRLHQRATPTLTRWRFRFQTLTAKTQPSKAREFICFARFIRLKHCPNTVFRRSAAVAWAASRSRPM